MAFDYRKLKGRIIEKFGSQRNFAEAMQWSQRTLSLKMSGKNDWKQTDIHKAMELLDLKEREIAEFFFAKEVQNT